MAPTTLESFLGHLGHEDPMLPPQRQGAVQGALLDSPLFAALNVVALEPAED